RVCPALSDFGLFFEPEFPFWLPPVGGDPKRAAKAKWKILTASYQNPPGGAARNAIDGQPNTIWHTHGEDGERTLPQDIAVDMGAVKTLKGFTYLPRQDGTAHGMVDRYTFSVSTDSTRWQQVATGEFGNLLANSVEQTIPFPSTKARYFKFTATHALKKNHAAVAELGVVEAATR
ncbi:MAG: discoidin domain-containing protein, partial [Akkermansiaceae bacterium]|nr:discoidin domain-containing protein [Akkermansiaceae bacterium]